MPRPRKPARLYLRRARGDRGATWVILHGSREHSTGTGADDRAGAEEALQRYLAQNYEPPRGVNRLEELLVADVMQAYLSEHAPTRPSSSWMAQMAAPIIEWWGTKTLSEVRGQSCRDYVRWRTQQRLANFTKREGRLVSAHTARHELSVLSAAINHWHREHGPLPAIPVVTLPPKSPPREDYFLSRSEIAARIRVARQRPETRHLVRFILLGFYSGTRSGAMLKLRWLPSTTGGWIDVDGGVIHRRAHGAERTNKRQPPARIHAHLLPHLRAWRRADMKLGNTAVIHYQGQMIRHCRNSWNSVREDAGATRRDGPHILRHSAATHFMAAGVDTAEVAGFLGMGVKVLLDVYGHHHPSFQHAVAQVSPKKQPNRKRTGIDQNA